MQLVAYGAQDVYLSGNPEITFFKVVYKRHTNYASEEIEQYFKGKLNFGGTAKCSLNRNGDLISNMCLIINLNGITNNSHNYVHRLGYALINSIKLEIGGSIIDKHTGNWMNIWHELSSNKHQKSWEKILGNGDSLSQDKTLHIPLEFWFCKNIGLALPLVALQYHDVNLIVSFNSANECIDYDFTSSKFQVNTYTNNNQSEAFITNLSNNKYVITWTSTSQDSSENGIYGQLYNYNHNKINSEFLVNTETDQNQQYSVISNLNQNEFLVIWESNHSGNYDIYGQKFNSNGDKIDNVFLINTTTDNNQQNGFVTKLVNNKFIIVYLSYNADNTQTNIYGKIFNNDNTVVLDEFQINEITFEKLNNIIVVSLEDDGFVVFWSNSNINNNGIFGKFYDNNGNNIGNEFIITSSVNIIDGVSATQLKNKNIIITWHSQSQDYEVYAKIYDVNQNIIRTQFKIN